MVLKLFRYELSLAGWKKIHSGSYLGFEFDLIGSRRCNLLADLKILVRFENALDDRTLHEWEGKYDFLVRKSKSLIWGSSLLLCLISERVNAVMMRSLERQGSGLFTVPEKKEAGVNVLVADTGTGHVYGRVPITPPFERTLTESTKRLLKRVIYDCGRQSGYVLLESGIN